MNSDHTTLFKSGWDAYQWALDNDVMGHRDILQKARLLIESVVGDQSIHMLDLGCGNAAPAIEIMSNLQLESYCGIDQAENVLREARKSINHLALPNRMFQRNLFDGIPESLTVNLIFSSFSVHHGQRDEKQALFKTLFHQADKGCYFCLIDIVCYPFQSRDAYIDMITEYLSRRVQQPQLLEQYIPHIKGYDFPETSDDLMAFAQSAGWQTIEELHMNADLQFPTAAFLFQR